MREFFTKHSNADANPRDFALREGRPYGHAVQEVVNCVPEDNHPRHGLDGSPGAE